MASQPPRESEPKDAENPQERFERLTTALFEVPRQAVLEAEREFKEREKRSR